MLPAWLWLVPIVPGIPALIVLITALIIPAHAMALMVVGSLLGLITATSAASIALCMLFEDWKK